MWEEKCGCVTRCGVPSVSLYRGILQIVDGSITEHHQSNLNDFVTSESVSFSL